MFKPRKNTFQKIFPVFLLVVFFPVSVNAQPKPPVSSYEIWVTNQQADSIQIIDGRTLEKSAEILLDDDGKPGTTKPHSVAISPDGRHALTANVGVKSDTRNVSVIRTKDRKVIQTLPAGPGAHMVAFSPDGRRAYVANAGGDSITEIEIDGKAEKFTLGRTLIIPLKEEKSRPTCLMVTPDSKTLIVTAAGAKSEMAFQSGFITSFDLPSGKERARILKLGDEVCVQGISPDGEKAYFTIGSPGEKWVVTHVKENRIIHIAPSGGKDPHGLALSPTGDRAVVVHRLTNGVTIYDGSSYKLLGTIKDVGDKPDLAAVSPEGKKVFLTLRGKPATPILGPIAGKEPGLAVVDLKEERVLKKIPLGGDPHGIAVR